MTNYYPIPPSFGALMKRQGDERNFVEEIRQFSNYKELLRRHTARDVEKYAMVKKLMLERRILEFEEVTRQIDFEDFLEYMLQGTVIDMLPVEKSIIQNIMLYLSTKPGDYAFDASFGCIVHNFDFRQITETPSRDQLRKSILEYLQRYEKRIRVSNVGVEVNDVQETLEGESPRLCRYIIVTISSTLVRTNEPLKDMKFRLVRYS